MVRVCLSQRVGGHEDGMSGTELGFLDHRVHVIGLQGARHQVAAVSEHHDHAL
ncbi:MAG: hypothetical protein BWX71_02372 [Deltaproteobacteria bacterium ADurb.Bin072]|nr:MAG: hypothetical protein BWX71_02372 [Deltaproteobacteria bacterium ADurb.Bin072]